jgi:hypothetical protein
MKLLVIHNKYKSKHIGGGDIVYEQELNNLRRALGDKNVFTMFVLNDDYQNQNI